MLSKFTLHYITFTLGNLPGANYPVGRCPDTKKTDIPIKLRKEFCDFFSEFIYKSINHRIIEGNFIADFKKAEVRPPYKNGVRANKSNHMIKLYRAINILSNISKIYERCLYSQLCDFFDKNICQITNVALVKASGLSISF